MDLCMPVFFSIGIFQEIAWVFVNPIHWLHLLSLSRNIVAVPTFKDSVTDMVTTPGKTTSCFLHWDDTSFYFSSIGCVPSRSRGTNREQNIRLSI